VDHGLIGLLLIVVLFGCLAAGMWIALALCIVGGVAIVFFSNAPVDAVWSTAVWGNSNEWSLTALPLFVWMGEILFRTRVSSEMFRGLAPWTGRLPGGLVHVNVLACGIFASVSGSSTATTATIGRITIPELMKRGYGETIVLGSLAGSGTLGILIPPSIVMIVYGVAADVPITQLFIAGVLPGLLLMALFMAVIVSFDILRPTWFPPREPRMPLAQMVRQTAYITPVLLLILGVIGSIYFGIATATEAAVIGVVGSLLYAAWTRELAWASFSSSLMAATVTSCMIAFILAGSTFLTVAMGFTGIPRVLAEWVGGQGLPNSLLLLLLTILFIIMGCFIDGISIVVLTASVLMPVVTQAGIDPLWFGIYLIFVVEMGLVTPPVGFNLFVIQGLTKRDLFAVSLGALPFFLAMCVAVVLIYLVPEIVTILPQTIRMGG